MDRQDRMSKFGVERPATERPSPSRPFDGRVALITGVSREIGIAATVAERMQRLGATVFATGWPQHDAEMPWGASPLGELPFAVEQHDLADPAVPAALVDEVVDRHGRIDIVVAVHARSSDGSLAEVTADELDRCWAVNVRSVVLLAQRFAQRYRARDQGATRWEATGRDTSVLEATGPETTDRGTTGRMLWFTSGQHIAAMDGEIAYAVSKGALHQMTRSIDHALSKSGIVANCINPGPVDTGYAVGEAHDRVAAMFPEGRWGTPDDVANLVAFLVGDEGGWIRGQVIDSEGGFNRFG